VAIPLLAGFLKANGIKVVTRDLNFDAAASYGVDICESAAREACEPPTLEGMNCPYFAAENALGAVADQYGGHWNVQVGFEYKSMPQTSSELALRAIHARSPFDEYFSSSVIPDILSIQPLVLGLCIACTNQLIPSLQLCRLLRDAGFVGFIVLGGNTISRLAKEMAVSGVFEFVDGFVTFQGEVPLLELYRAVSSGGAMKTVSQLTWRDNTGKIITNSGKGLFVPNNGKAPDYSGLPIGQYWGANYINLVAARGCYYAKCSFCAIPYGWGENGFAGMRDVELVYRDMLTCIDLYGINRFKFVDEALSPSFMRGLAARIRADNLHVEWEGYVRCEPAWVDIEFVEAVSEAGFRKGYFGLEIVPSDGRVHLNKRDQPAPEQLVTVCATSGIKVHLFCMFGFPGTGEDDAKRTADFVLDHRDCVDTADIFPWTYTKHTHVAGVEPVTTRDRDWTLEFTHRPVSPGVLSSDAIIEIAARYEELLWDEAPGLLHPVYRLVSPWSVRPGDLLCNTTMDHLHK
jgi:hypothetical protein